MVQDLPDWFSGNTPLWERLFAAVPADAALEILQIGAYTGDATVWLTDRFPAARVTDVDPWTGSPGEAVHGELDWGEVERAYRAAVAGRRVVVERTTSDEYFARVRPAGVFDVVYVDGDHRAEQVRRDAVNGWAALRAGGLLGFDDYGWRGHGPGGDPCDAIDWWLGVVGGGARVVWRGWQVWVVKV